jgi:hypothetical protein
MGMKRFKKAVAVTGEYTGSDGQTKKQYQTVGTLMVYDDGGLALKLDALPLGEWNGWLSFYDFDEERKQGYDKGTAAAREAMAPEVTQSRSALAAQEGIPIDDIPF